MESLASGRPGPKAVKEYPFKWTDEWVATAKGLWNSGWSGTDIAHHINARAGSSLTRSAVIGKVNRLGLVRKPNTNGHKAVTRNHKRAGGNDAAILAKIRNGKQVQKIPAMAAPTEPESLNLSLNELRESTCRWPHGAEPPFQFCGHPVERWDRPYCEHHNSRAVAKRDA